MKRLKLIILTLTSLTLLALPSLAYADHGSGGGDDNNGSVDSATSTSTSSNDSTTSTTSVATETRHGGSNKTSLARAYSQSNDSEQETETKESKAKTEGQALVDALLKTEKKHSESERAKNCQAAQKGLTTKLTNLQKNAASYQSTEDAIYQKALDYAQTNNLNPSGIDQLEATANADKTTAAASVGALGGLSVTLDCTSNTVATNVATFRAAASQARSDLLAYKTAVKAVLMALEGVT